MGDRERRWAAVCAHRDRLLRLARARVGDADDAEDCVQEAMLRCVEFPELDEERLAQFLTTVTVRLCADVHRGRARRERLSRRLSGFWGTDPGPEDSVCDRAESAWLSRRIDELTPRQREIVEARAEGLSCGAVADRLLVPYTTVESALARARRSLRGALESTLGVAALPVWVRGRRLLAGGAVATAAAFTVGGVELPERAVRPPASPVAAAPAVRAWSSAPAVRAPAVVVARNGPGAGADTMPARQRPAARPAGPRPPDVGGLYVGGRQLAGQRTVEHDYTPVQRGLHCVRYGVAVGRRVQCRYPPGDPNNVDESFGTPGLEWEEQ